MDAAAEGVGAQGGTLPAERQPTGFLDGFNVEVTATGLVLPADMPLDRFIELVRLLGAISSAVPFYIGDTALFGDDAYGQAYAQAMNDFGLAYQTLANYAHVCRWVQPDVRRDDLSFGHHAAVSGMTTGEGDDRVPDKARQRYWLQQAVDKDWSRAQLREAIAAEGRTVERGARAGEPEREQPGAPVGAQGAAPPVVQQARQPEETDGHQHMDLAPAVWHEGAKALRDVFEAAVPVEQLAQRAGGYYAVPEDVMAEVAMALGEEWVAPQPTQYVPPAVIEGQAQHVPPVPADADVPMVAPLGGPGQHDLGETFDGF